VILVFDVGATKTRLALVEGETLGEIVRLDTDRSVAGFERLQGVVQELAAGHKLTAVAGGLPGQLDAKTGALSRVMNMPAWNGTPALKGLSEVVDCPVYLANDTVLVGLGEARYGAGDTKGVMAYVTISSGVNAVRLVDGAVDGTIRLFDVGQQLLSDGDGRVVTLEALTGGAAFVRRQQRDPSGVRDGRTWRAEEHYLARGLYNTILHWTPETVVFGGSMMRDIDLAAVESELEALRPELPYVPRLAEAALGDRGGLYGAMVWAGEHSRS